MLYSRFLVPLAILAYLIRKNPFYRNYPIMLPIMVFTFSMLFIRTVKYSKTTNHMVHQILMDPTGSEVTFIFKNKFQRRLRSDQTEATYMVSNLVNPPQGDDYRPLPGSLFPQEYPFD